MATIRGTKVLCKKCFQWHELEYQLQINNTKHLVYRCPKHQKGQHAVEFLPFQPNLPIQMYSPIQEQEQQKKEKQLKQSSLFEKLLL